MRVVAGSAVALRSRMLNFGFFDFLCLFGVAGHAHCLGIGLRQDDLPILRRCVAAVAHLVFERIVYERLHQLRLRETDVDRGTECNSRCRMAGRYEP